MTGPIPSADTVSADAVPAADAVPSGDTLASDDTSPSGESVASTDGIETGLTPAAGAPPSNVVDHARDPDGSGGAVARDVPIDISVPRARGAYLTEPAARAAAAGSLPAGPVVPPPVSGALSGPTRALDNHLGGVEAANYRRYEFDLIAPYCGHRLLEVGAGLGDFAAQFNDLEHLVLADGDPLCLAALRRRFADRAEVEVVATDLSDADRPLSLVDPVDTVLGINVLEHIEDDERALRTLARLLVPGGRIVCWVPGYPALYGDFDRSVGHFRRYTPASARAVAERAGLTVELSRPVNLLGGIAWWAAVRLGRQGDPSPRLVECYDRYVVPATRAIESRIRVPFGQSVLLVARVPAAPRS